MDAAFALDGEFLVPTPFTVSPWSEAMISGRYIAALVAWAVERDAPPGDALIVSRLTVDMFRPVPMAPLRVTTTPIRSGRRLRLVEVSLWHDHTEVTRAGVLLLAPSEPLDVGAWAPEPWDFPGPDDLPTTTRLTTMAWEFRSDQPLGQGRGRVWMREFGPLVAGHEITPLVRAALAGDFVNPLANSGPEPLQYINADLTMYLTRAPVGEWIGMESAGHLAADGLGLGTAWLYDETGRFGTALGAALPDGRIRQRN